MPAIFVFGCFLLMAGSAWAQVREDPWQPVSQLHHNPPRSYYGQSSFPSIPKSLQGFDTWFQQQREQHRQQHERYRQEIRPFQSNPSVYSSEHRSVPFTAESSQGFDTWFQQQREQHRQHHERYRQQALQHELNQKNRLRTYDRLHWGPLQRQ